MLIERKRRGLRRSILCISTILAGSATFPAFAQSNSDLPPATPVVDVNSVDVASGRYINRSKGIAFGDVSFSNVWNGTVEETTFTNLVRTNTFNAFVFIDGNSYRFVNYGQSGGDITYTPLVPDGSTLTRFADGQVKYTNTDGTRYEFTPVLAGTRGMTQSGSAADGSTARLEKIVRANGQSQVAHYRVAVLEQNCTGGGRFGLDNPNCQRTTYQRVQSFTTNTGAMLKAIYASNSPGSEFNKLVGVKAINLGEDYCDPNADSCSNLTKGWPELQVMQSTDANGVVHKIFQSPNSSYQATVTGAGVSSINLDGAGNPNIQIGKYPDNRVHTLTINGKTSAYTYALSGANEAVTVTNADGKSTTYNIAHTGDNVTRLDSKTNGLGNTTTYAYDSSGRLYRTAYPEGNATTLSFDPVGRVVETRSSAKPGSGAADVVTNAGYVTNCTVESLKYCLKPLWTGDARGNRTDYTYSADHAEATKVELPAPSGGQARPTIDYGYTALYAKIKDTSGNLVNADSPVWKLTSVRQCGVAATCYGSSAETLTEIQYAVAAGGINLLPTQVTVRAGDNSVSSTQTYGYDAFDNVVSVDGPLPGSDDTRHFQWNSDRRLTGSIDVDPDGGGPLPRRAARYTYTVGKLTQTESGTVTSTGVNAFDSFVVAQTKATDYDAWDYLVKDTVSAGGVIRAVTQYDYDDLGRPECVAVRMNPSAFSWLPGSACDLGTSASFGPDRITRQQYDAADQPTIVERGYKTADVSTETTAYTPNGATSSVTDGENNRTAYEYDGFDRLTVTRYPVAQKGAGAASGGDYEQLAYDAADNVTSRRLRDGQVLSYGYDNLGRRVYDDNPNSNVAEVDVSYTYDLLGRLTRAQDQNGWYNAFGYDALGRTVSQSSNLSSNALQYDAAGRMTRETWGDGFFVTYDYLNTGAMTAVRENGGFALASFGYDTLGRRTSLTRGNGTTTSYHHDGALALDQLTQDLAGGSADVSYGFSYNPAGQIATRSVSNDGYVFTGHYNVDRPYTANGLNQYTQSGPVIPTYDARGNVTSAGNGSSFGYNTRNALTWGNGQFFYHNPMGLLTIKPGSNLDYVGTRAVSEINGGIQRRYVYGPGDNEPLVWYEGASTNDRRYLHADERGSIVSLSDNAGNAIRINTYDEYGIPGTNNLGLFQYTGQKWLPEIGMYDYKARVYSPTLGRFMQTDPIGYADGVNWYNYVGSDPINKVDPTGLRQFCFIIPFTWSFADYIIPDSRRSCVEIPDYQSPFANNGGFTGGWGLGTGGGSNFSSQPRTRTPQNGQPHNYTINRDVQCSAGSAFNKLKAPGMSAPGSPAARNGFTPRITLTGNNPISQSVDPGRMTITNTTLPTHQFYPGSVVMQVAPLESGWSRITITGTGSGNDPFLNDVVGLAYFGSVANAVQELCSPVASSLR
ncbi:RHS repeat domain-containing protein [Sphingomonas sp. Leaf37]|uniref:RHS repeat domain-containing protein n=1 Tax=Sphingomonas sp. Leaf37 TaxID=2876552 RepID=UPI001E355E7E|nr:RHS repeat-associated core domain-containing protein [Sphingomonas sp. Leaf37]